MAAEALKVVALSEAPSEAGADKAELARSWRFGPGEPRRRSLLEAAARRKLVFDGDDGAESEAAEISDGFEHRYRDVGEHHGPQLSIRDRTGRRLRSAFLGLAGVPEAVRGELTSGRYEGKSR